MLSRLKPVSCLFQRMLGSINLENGLERESRNAQPTKLVKRKVALVIAYVGSNYYGLQMDRNSSLPTVEATLEQELYALGHIRESNHKELGKIHWSRSSRTDKKVIVSGGNETQCFSEHGFLLYYVHRFTLQS